MQTEGPGPGANGHAALGTSVHLIFVAHQSVEESTVWPCGGSREDIILVFEKAAVFQRRHENTDEKH